MARLADVNSRDLLGAIRLGCEAMGRVFDADDPHGAPFFDAQALPDPRLAFSDVHSEGHVPGRHLNALLAAEGLVGLAIDEEAVRRHAAALFFSYSGELPLPLNRARRDGPLELWCPHNLREGFHGLAALVRSRGDDRALDMAARSIETIGRVWRPPNRWLIPVEPGSIGLQLVAELGRAIGPLVKLWRAADHQPALDLALRVKDLLIAEPGAAYPADGSFRPDVLGPHVHSITSTLSSLAQLADATADAALLDRVRAFYRNGLWQVRDELGWAIETTRPEANPDKGEANSSGDIVETALILAGHSDADAAEDAERIVRAHILPSQLRDVSWIPESAGTDDGTRDVARRLRGTWGFPAPYGHAPIGLERIKFNLDIVGGTVSSLAEVAASGRWSDEPPATATTTTELELRHRTRTINVRLRGHEVVAMDGFGADLTFFPPL